MGLVAKFSPRGMTGMDKDNIYWLFSSSAQSISAFVAFLLAGFTLVHMMMETIQQKDDTLADIHAQLKRHYYLRLRGLFGITGLSIVLSLAMVWFNHPDWPNRLYYALGVSLVNTVAIGGGIWFVIGIVNPSNYENTARKLIGQADVRKELGLSNSPIRAGDFLEQFIKLEARIRHLVKLSGLYQPSQGGPGMSFSVRRMIEVLGESETIGKDLIGELLSINKYRNLVAHGHTETADKSMVQRISAAQRKIEEIAERIAKQRGDSP
jgi:hypothetical protein